MGFSLPLVAAVVVRETARLMVAAYLGLRLRAVLLLPIGGLFAYANPESQETANQGFGQFAIALVGPLANCLTALMLAAAFIGAGGDVKILAHPWISAAALIRSAVWMQAAWVFCTCFRLTRSTSDACCAEVSLAGTAFRLPAAQLPASASCLRLPP